VSQKVDITDETNSRRVEKIKADSALQVAQMQFNAESKLHDQGIISALALKRTEAERDGKIAERDYARERAEQAGPAGAAKLKASAERVALLQARVDSLRAAVDALTLRAPFDGVVAKIDAKPGASLAGGTLVAEVITSKLQINLEVAEQYANSVHVGQKIRLQNGLSGLVTSISPVAEGGVVKGTASIDGDTSELRSNTSLIGEAIMQEHGTGLFIQADGLDIAQRTIQAQVQTKDGTIETRALNFGPRYGQKVVLISGATAQEQVVGLATEQNP
jgi:hypothetical protein